MRWTFVIAAALAATPAYARDVAIDSAVYVERAEAGALYIAPAERVMRGDRVVTILRWQAPPAKGRYTATSAIPAGLRLESTSHPDIEVSTDNGRSWSRLGDLDGTPAAATHLRWPVDGEGRLSYRAVVR